MKYTVIGTRKVNFTPEDGRSVVGTSLYVACDADGVEGMMTEKLFVSDAKMPAKGITVGQDIEVFFNKYGKVDAVKAVGA